MIDNISFITIIHNIIAIAGGITIFWIYKRWEVMLRHYELRIEKLTDKQNEIDQILGQLALRRLSYPKIVKPPKNKVDEVKKTPKKRGRKPRLST